MKQHGILLERALDAHGGLERCREITCIAARADIRGTTWEKKGWPEVLAATHNPQQTFFFDTAGLLRPLDYQPDVTGAAVAHYTHEHRTFGAFVFPTQRRVYRRNPDGTADTRVAIISLDIADVAVPGTGNGSA